MKDSPAKRAVDRIKENILIEDVLSHFNYRVRVGALGREQQFACDLHGDGVDGKPSARTYPESNVWYCFACGTRRDAIHTVREKEGLKFWEAVRYLETHFGLEKGDYGTYEGGEDKETQNTEKAVDEALSPHKNSGRHIPYDNLVLQVERMLDIVTREREFPLSRILTFWNVFDFITHHVHREEVTEATGKEQLHQLYTRILREEEDL